MRFGGAASVPNGAVPTSVPVVVRRGMSLGIGTGGRVLSEVVARGLGFFRDEGSSGTSRSLFLLVSGNDGTDGVCRCPSLSVSRTDGTDDTENRKNPTKKKSLMRNSSQPGCIEAAGHKAFASVSAIALGIS